MNQHKRYSKGQTVLMDLKTPIYFAMTENGAERQEIIDVDGNGFLKLKSNGLWYSPSRVLRVINGN